MAKQIRNFRNEHQKNIVKLFSAFDGSKNRRKIFEDFIAVSAIAIANACDKDHFEDREKRYLDIIKQYKRDEIEVFTKMLAETVLGLEETPDCDFLGELYMNLDFGSQPAGQFFTPYSVCQLMGAITGDPDELKSKIENHGFVSVNDPACGAGALLVAFANECRRNDINYQTSVLFVAQDIDSTVGMMCYIALSLLGCPGYVVIDNTITNPCTAYDRRFLLPKENNGNIWYTPMFKQSWFWQGRVQAAKMDLMFSSLEKAEKPAVEVIDNTENFILLKREAS